MNIICSKIVNNISKVIVGKEKAIELLLISLLAEGHVLMEDVPGVGKTLLARSLARSIAGDFKRIQFTPDLLPSDITGFNIYNQNNKDFSFQAGPVFTNILLADEINRTVPRTQSSLLESMEEKQVTTEGKTHPLPRPFFVIATQNPIDLEGTFPLPEAQLDRFSMKVNLGYPAKKEEILILKRFQEEDPIKNLNEVVTPAEIIKLQEQRKKVHVSPLLHDYIVSIVQATRNNQALLYGASPRASISLLKAAQARALIRKRDFVLPDDIKFLLSPVLVHRLILTPQERIKGNKSLEVLQEIISSIPVPASAEPV